MSGFSQEKLNKLMKESWSWESGGSSGGHFQADWNQGDNTQPDYVKNRTHKEVEAHNFPFRTKGIGSPNPCNIFVASGSNNVSAGDYLIRVSDVTPSIEDILVDGFVGGRTAPVSITSDMILSDYDGGYGILYNNMLYAAVVLNPSGGRVGGAFGDNQAVFADCSEPGLYMYTVNNSATGSTSSQLKWGGVVPLDEKYIPDTIARTSQLFSGNYNDLENKPTIPEGLPAVTADNNGAFLRVVDGIWAVATIANAEEASF